jgi:hypothetical protein
MKQQRVVMLHQLKAMRAQGAEMGEQTDALRKSVTHAENSAMAAKQSADAARESIILTHRPKVIVRGVVIAWEAIITHEVSVDALNKSRFDDGQLSGFFYAVNVGNQPAKVTILEEYLSFDPKLPLERPYEAGQEQREVNIALKPGESRKLPFQPKAITIRDPKEVVLLGRPICAIGRLTYIDELGNRRETGFARKLSPEAGRFEAVPDPNYEYQD